MAIISWGKPKLEFALLGADGTYEETDFREFPTPVQDSTQLTTEVGNKLEAFVEGGERIDVRYDKNKYKCEFELYKTNGAGKDKPIFDDDGIIRGEYALCLTPEDETQEGWIMDRASVTVEETWAANIGHKWKYTFEALKPANGNLLKPYKKTL